LTSSVALFEAVILVKSM